LRYAKHSKILGTPSMAVCRIILSSVQEGVSQRRYELETGVQLDVDDYVEKPIESNVLLERVGKILKRIGKE